MESIPPARTSSSSAARKRKMNRNDICVSLGSGAVSSGKVCLYLGDGRWKTSVTVVRSQRDGNGD